MKIIRYNLIISILLINGYLFGLSYPYDSIHILKKDDHSFFSDGNKEPLKRILTQTDPKVIIEVGTWLGSSAIFMAYAMHKDGTLYAVDTWLGSHEHFHNVEWKSKLPTLYQQFLSNVVHAELTHKIIPIRMESVEAASALNVLADLIYIDATHDEDAVYKDIIEWSKKLTPNGVLCGDDWSYPGVVKAVKRAALDLNKTYVVQDNFWYFDYKN